MPWMRFRACFGVFAFGNHVAHAGHLGHHVLHAAHLGHHLELLAEVVEREIALCELVLLLLDFLLAQLGLNALHLFDDAHDVALAHDPLGHALGIEVFEGLQLLADADELDRDLGDFLDGQRRAAAGIAVELGEDDAVEIEGVVEGLGAIDRVLAGHGVADEKDLVGLDQADRSA